MTMYSLSCIIDFNVLDNVYTFKYCLYSKITCYTSIINYFLCSKSLRNVLAYTIIDEGDNLFDHIQVKVVMNVHVIYSDKVFCNL